jgi:hypothetical protein
MIMSDWAEQIIQDLCSADKQHEEKLRKVIAENLDAQQCRWLRQTLSELSQEVRETQTRKKFRARE